LKTREQLETELAEARRKRDDAQRRALVARKVTETRELQKEATKWRLEAMRLERLLENGQYAK